MQVTIRDVAASAAVSAATVSRVLNGRTDVRGDLRDRVLAAVAELGYRPNGPARSLRTRAARALGVVISDITNAFFTTMVRGIEDVAQEAGYSVLLANTDENPEKEVRQLEVAAAEQLAGVILAPTSSAAARTDILADNGIPIVTVDRRLRSAGLDSVTVNNERAALEATQHLIDEGWREIAIIAGPGNTTTGSRRLAGYRSALRAAARPVRPDLVVRSNFRVDGGQAAMRALLAKATPPDAVLVSNNLMTIGALQALSDAGVGLGEDIALVAFDDVEWATALRPPLTVVAQPTYEIGRRAAELLLRRVRAGASAPEHVVLPAELKVRGSSRRPPRRT